MASVVSASSLLKSFVPIAALTLMDPTPSLSPCSIRNLPVVLSTEICVLALAGTTGTKR